MERSIAARTKPGHEGAYASWEEITVPTLRTLYPVTRQAALPATMIMRFPPSLCAAVRPLSRWRSRRPRKRTDPADRISSSHRAPWLYSPAAAPAFVVGAALEQRGWGARGKGAAPP